MLIYQASIPLNFINYFLIFLTTDQELFFVPLIALTLTYIVFLVQEALTFIVFLRAEVLTDLADLNFLDVEI